MMIAALPRLVVAGCSSLYVAGLTLGQHARNLQVNTDEEHYRYQKMSSSANFLQNVVAAVFIGMLLASSRATIAGCVLSGVAFITTTVVDRISDQDLREGVRTFVLRTQNAVNYNAKVINVFVISSFFASIHMIAGIAVGIGLGGWTIYRIAFRYNKSAENHYRNHLRPR